MSITLVERFFLVHNLKRMIRMSEGFELSFKNKQVRMAFIIMVPTFVAVIFLALMTEIPMIYIEFLPILSWAVFFIWRYLYKKKQRKQESLYH